MKRFLVDLIFIITIIFVTVFAWHGILGQTIEGEGYYYFSPTLSLISPDGNLTDLAHGIDNFAKIITFIQEKTIGGNMQGYMAVQFVFIILINISFYLFVRKVTKSPLIAVLASIYEAVYYTGNFQFYARGHYHWFYQRAVELIPIFASFYYIIRFAKERKLKYYLFSFLFFAIALFLANYTTFLMPFVPIYLIIFSISKLKNIKRGLILVSLSLPFILVNYFFTKNASLNLNVIHPNQTLIQSFFLLKDVPSKIFYQLVVVTVPFSVTNFFSKIFNLNNKDFIQSLVIPTILFYLLVFGNLYKSKSKYFEFALSAFFGLLAVLFLVVYFNRVIVYNEIQEGRYYYVPGFYVGIILSVFITNILKGRKRAIIVIILLALWITTNTHLIWKKIKSTQFYYDQTKIMLSFLSSTKNTFPEGSLVFLPNPPMPSGPDFLAKYYSGKNTTFFYLDQNWKTRIPKGLDKDRIFVFDFRDKYKIVNRSEEHRKMLPL